jgi:DNA-directed RNA polymerase subunit L
MAEELKMIPIKNIDLSGYRMKFQLRGVPVQYANAIRRIMLNEMPVVEIADVKIHENTTLMPHEMLQLRTELLPINVRPSEEDLVRGVKLTLNVAGDKRIYTSDFKVEGGRADIILKDRDLNTPIYFLKTKDGEAVHITAGLRVNPLSSHVCVATYMYHVDEELVVEDKTAFLEDNEGWENAERVFENFYKQRSFYKNAKGRPDWFDFEVESIGVVPARDLVKDALAILKRIVIEWSKNDIIREKEENTYRINSVFGGHTVGALVQAVLYESGLCQFVSYDIPHPLRTDMTIRILTDKTPEEIVNFATSKIAEYCDTCVSLL